MKEEWIGLEEFPGYLISNYGQVFSEKRGKLIRPFVNASNVLYVSFTLYQNGSRTRGLAKLVAKYFVPQDREDFTTPIYLDGNRANVRADNLMWRTRPFAIYFQKELETDPYGFWNQPFLLVETQEEFQHLREPAQKYGITQREIRMCCYDGRKAWPTQYHFQYV